MQEIHDKATAAREIEADLRGQSARIAERQAKIADERENIAHAALTGDASARDKLTALRQEAAGLTDQAKDVAAAINHAEREIIAADAAVAALDRRQKAEAATALAGRFEETGREAMAALDTFARAFAEMQGIAATLRDSGATQISRATMEMNMRRATQTSLMKAGLQGEFLAPGHRIEMAGLIAGWAADIREGARRSVRAADAVLGTTTKRKAA